MRILLADDDRAMARTLRQGLEESGHEVRVAFNGIEALTAAREHNYDVVVLDVMMPVMDGITVVRRLRSFEDQTPIVMLTARDGVGDVVRGLQYGADDYITKPFSFQILVARLRAVTRRGPVRQPVSRVADLTLDPATREVYRGEAQIELTATEFKLLETLIRKPEHVVTRESLLETVWGCSAEVESNTLDAFIRLLRQKIDQGRPKLIHTFRGVGYSIRESET
jgi:two-component system response regulator MprA